MKWGARVLRVIGGSIVLPEIWIYLAKHPSPRSSCPSSSRCKQANQATQAAPCTSREGARTPHGPALSPVISGQERSPSARPGGPPRRPIAATPPSRSVLDRKAGTVAAHLRLQHGAAYFKAARRATTFKPSADAEGTQHAEYWSSPRAPQAQDKAPRQEGSKTASIAARNKRNQLFFANKCHAHRACRCGDVAERDERLAVFVLQNSSTAEKRGPRWRSLSRQTAQCGNSGESGASRWAP